MTHSRLKISILLILGLLLNTPVNAQQSAEAQLRITLSTPAREAIDSGVLLEFACNFAALRSFGLFSYYSKQHRHRFVIQRHSLSKRYVVRRDNLETPRIFKSISEATNYISEQALRLLEFYDNQQQTAYLRLRLNKYALPGPMRLNAFIASGWNVDSGWVHL